MKRKRGFKLFALSAVLALGVSSCTISPQPTPPVEPDEQIYAVYLMAKDSGYQGTYEEWLETIRGADGSTILFGSGEPSATQGKAGDAYVDVSNWNIYVRSTSWTFVGNIMGAQGQPGENGVTPHIGENGNWWIGDQDTGIHAQGNQGNPGENGVTPHIGENGNWWIGEQDTGIHAQGEQGNPGQNGLTPHIGENGNWWIGETDTGVHAQGEAGQNGHTPEIIIGENGNWFVDGVDSGVHAQGNQGNPGANGLTPYIGENGNWWIGEQDTGIHAQGEAGQNGITPHIGENGNWWIGEQDTGIHAQGEQGNPGQNGLTPHIGENGNWWIGDQDTGIHAQGEAGQNGVTPHIGENGNWWIGNEDTGIHAQGEQGNPGQNGLTPYIGENGNWWIGEQDTGVHAQGEAGQNGHTPVITIGENGNWFVDDVDTGVHAQGQQGQPGQNGNPGQNGLTPYIGENGNWWIGETDTGVHAQGEAGQNGHTPEITIGQNGHWFVDGVDTGVAAQGQQGNPGQNGQPGQTAWANTILPSEHGYVTANYGSAYVGELITFYAYPDYGYKLESITLNGEDYTYQFDIYKNCLTVPMVEHGYVVRATFVDAYYNVYFVNYDGELLYEGRYMEGDSPSDVYYSLIPYREDDEEFSYNFVGWNQKCRPVYEDTVYWAVYEPVSKLSVAERYGIKHNGTEDDPFTNDEACIVSHNLQDQDKNTEFYIKGVISRYYYAPENKPNYVSFYLTPSEEDGEVFEVFRMWKDDGSSFTFDEVFPGLEIMVRGRLTIYSGHQAETVEAYFVSSNVGEIGVPTMETHNVTVAEAIEIGQSLHDGDTTYDKYAITGYVYERSGSTYYLADSLENPENLFAIRGLSYDIRLSIKYGARVTFTDHIHNYHGTIENNIYTVVPSMFEVLEEGQSWPDTPTGIHFYDDYGNEITKVEASGDMTINFTLDGVNPSASYIDRDIEGELACSLYIDKNANVIRISDIYASGTSTILFYNEFGEQIGSLDVELTFISVESIELDTNEVILNVGDMYYLRDHILSISPAGASLNGIYLVSSNESVIGIYSNYRVRAFGYGEAYVSVCSDYNIIATIHFVVGETITGIWTESVSTLNIGETTRIITHAYPNDSLLGKVTFASSNPDIAYVDENGLVVALAQGSTSIRVTEEHGFTSWIYLTIIDQSSVAIKEALLDEISANFPELRDYLSDSVDSFGYYYNSNNPESLFDNLFAYLESYGLTPVYHYLIQNSEVNEYMFSYLDGTVIVSESLSTYYSDSGIAYGRSVYFSCNNDYVPEVPTQFIPYMVDTIYVGDVVPFVLFGTNDACSYYNFESSDTSIAVVKQDNLIEFLAPGEVTIICHSPFGDYKYVATVLSSEPEIPTNAYYLKGDFNEWGEYNEYIFTPDAEDENVYVLSNVSLMQGDNIKVNNPATGEWFGVSSSYEGCYYTVGENGNCVVAESGVYDVVLYVNSEYGNHIQLIKSTEPEPENPSWPSDQIETTMSGKYGNSEYVLEFTYPEMVNYYEHNAATDILNIVLKEGVSAEVVYNDYISQLVMAGWENYDANGGLVGPEGIIVIHPSLENNVISLQFSALAGELPLDSINEFLTYFEIGFNLTEDLPNDEDAIYELNARMLWNFYYYSISVSGDKLSSWTEFMIATLSNAGYTFNEDYSTEIFLSFVDENGHEVVIEYDQASDKTIISFWTTELQLG